MTLIVALIDNSVIVMGSDSASTSESSLTVLSPASQKHWTVNVLGLGDVCIGFSGSLSVQNVLKFAFTWPPMTYETTCAESIIMYLTSKVWPKMLEHIVKRFAPVESLRENLQDWTLLIGTRGKLFTMYPDGFVETSTAPYAAIGDAADIANGVLYALHDSCELTSWEKLDKAFQASHHFKNTVRGPLHMTCTFR